MCGFWLHAWCSQGGYSTSDHWVLIQGSACHPILPNEQRVPIPSPLSKHLFHWLKMGHLTTSSSKKDWGGWWLGPTWSVCHSWAAVCSLRLQKVSGVTLKGWLQCLRVHRPHQISLNSNQSPVAIEKQVIKQIMTGEKKKKSFLEKCHSQNSVERGKKSYMKGAKDLHRDHFERKHFERNDISLLKSLTEMMANRFVS